MDFRGGDRILGAQSARRRMYKKASSELVVARRRRGSDNGREHVRVAAADRVQGPLVEDHGDDPIQRERCSDGRQGRGFG